ncbi:putative ATPase [Kibdelosporangium banguiense]|uniref:ATPase n=1 Tax=Kibdelosporangium banguiense TaxID=1365924 RepID=A0ABS4TDX8_9PSEU|nr:AAA family ATPase [Kibdelosporangium banguiense]MBP2322622.1 putative ATPase [Kibdelosporangium banguiense]
MELQAFRVQNYKRIEDTGWINCHDLTVLVGKNEAGKSAVLRGLSKIKPSDGEGYDGLREFPRRRYTDEFDDDDWPVASVRLLLNDDERAELSEITAALSDVTTAEVTRRYSGKYVVGFTPQQGVKIVTRRQADQAVEEARSLLADAVAPDGRGEDLRVLKEQIGAALTNAVNAIPSNHAIVSLAQAEALLAAVTQHINEEWQQPCLNPVAEPLREVVGRSRTHVRLGEARDWVVKQMPQFVYFDRYDVLDSSVHVPTFIQQLTSTPHAPRVRTTHCLFRHVGLDVREIHRLGVHQPGQPENDAVRRQIDERAIRTSSASQAMTRKFGEWWLQRRHTFRYQADADYLRIWVSDDLDPSEIELDQRSVGMQYFFSFFLVFLVEAEDAHVNSILLLDEPGTSLHGLAQAKIVEFLRKLSKDNQVLYSSHSPFMIDAEHLETVRPVYEDPTTGSTKISEDVWPKDKDALFPLQAALGYQLAQSLFISKRQVAVEGMTDYWIFKALDHAVSATGRTGLDPSIIITPSGGASRMIPLASMLIGHQIDVVAVLDGDEPGRREGKKLVERLLGDANRTVFTGDYTPDGNTTGETEDLFPDDYFLTAVKKAYGSIDLRPNADEKQISNIVDRLTALFTRKGHGEFEKWKVNRALADQIEDDPHHVPAETLDAASMMFEKINNLFTQ